MKYPKPGLKEKPPKSNEKAKIFTTLTLVQREKVFKRFGGNCAYCGHEIDLSNFQVDHKIPRAKLREADFWDNLMPSCRACNIRKNTMSIERFRAELSRDIEQLKRDSPKFRLLLKYGLIELHQEPVEFYFEKVKNGKANMER